MNDLNKWIGIGRLTRDLGSSERDFGYLQNGTAVGTISIAVNRSRKGADGQYVDEVSYFDVHIYGKTAENLKPYLTKGQQVGIEGVLKQERWQDKQTGNNMSKVVINALTVQLLGGKKDDNGQQNTYAQQYQNQQGGAPRFQPANNQPPINQGYSDASYTGDFPEDILF